ncbi:MAG: hypothetical protein J1G38_04500 [Clostridiales bacterium]|nr:hypothetical protein [Clostridiales bacterium]
MITADNRPSNTNISPMPFTFLFIACIVIATISFIGLIFALRKRIRINKGLAVNTSGNAAAIALLTPLLLLCIVGIVFIGIGREATDDDINIDLEQKISLNMNFDITAYEDISDLEIKFEFTNKNGVVISTKYKKVGDVQKGKTYQVSIKLTEFSLSDIANAYEVSAEVTGGRVSYFS